MQCTRLRNSSLSATIMCSWRPLLVALALGLGTSACQVGSDVGHSSSALSTTGRVTQLCGFNGGDIPPGPSPYPACEGVCVSQGSDGFCSDPPDSGSRLELYGCTVATNGASCDGRPGIGNGGVLLETFINGETVSFSSLATNPTYDAYCTFQLDVMRPGDPLGDLNGNRDFIIWQRDDCDPPRPVCEREALCEGGEVCAPEGTCEADFDADRGSYSTCEPFTVSQTPPGPYELGSHDVTVTVTDEQGSDSCQATVVVLDCEPPDIDCLDPIVLGRDHEYRTITLDELAVATDVCAGVLPIEFGKITSVTSDEPDDTTGDGKFVNDIVCVDDQTVELREERRGQGNGRVYVVHFQYTDPSGNVAEGECPVWVPHDKPDEEPIEDVPPAQEVVCP